MDDLEVGVSLVVVLSGNVLIVPLQIGFVFGVFLAVLLGATMPAFSRVFSTDVDVLNIIKGLIPVCYSTFLRILCLQ